MRGLAVKYVILIPALLAGCTQMEPPICLAVSSSDYSCETFEAPAAFNLKVKGTGEIISLMRKGECKPNPPASALMLDGYNNKMSPHESYTSIISYKLKDQGQSLQAYDIRLELGSDKFEYFNCAHIAAISAYGYLPDLPKAYKSSRFVETAKISLKTLTCDDEGCERRH